MTVLRRLLRLLFGGLCGKRYSQHQARREKSSCERSGQRNQAPSHESISNANNQCEFDARTGEKRGRFGGPGATRTPDKRFRKPLLYPPELRGHVAENGARVAESSKVRDGRRGPSCTAPGWPRTCACGPRWRSSRACSCTRPSGWRRGWRSCFRRSDPWRWRA
jgi:hypothetical protein